MPFHVFIDKAVDATPDGRARLAASIAAKYRLPEAQIAQYLQAGRFRVKSGVEEAIARKFAAELVALGAIVSVEDAQSGAKLALAAPARAAAPPPPAMPAAAATPPQRPGAAPPQRPGAAPLQRSGAAPGASAPAVSPTGQRFESGLAAAFSAGASDAPAGLGALDNLAGVSLSSIDGVDDGVAEPAGLSAAGPPSRPMSADAFDAPDAHDDAPLQLFDEPPPKPKPKAQAATPSAPAAQRPKAAGTPPPMAVPPLELEEEEAAAPVAAASAAKTPSHTRSAFAAPDDNEAPLDLALGPMQPLRPKPAAAAPAPPQSMAAELTPLAEMPANAAPAPRPAKPRPAPLPVEGGPLAQLFAGKPRRRILAGAALALVLGYLPATLYASSAEDSRYGKIRSDLTLVQQGATTQAAWEALDDADGPRQQAVRDMERARGRIRSTAAIFWLVVSGGVALAWFKKLA